MCRALIIGVDNIGAIIYFFYFMHTLPIELIAQTFISLQSEFSFPEVTHYNSEKEKYQYCIS